jgi:hypothetical protein
MSSFPTSSLSLFASIALALALVAAPLSFDVSAWLLTPLSLLPATYLSTTDFAWPSLTYNNVSKPCLFQTLPFSLRSPCLSTYPPSYLEPCSILFIIAVQIPCPFPVQSSHTFVPKEPWPLVLHLHPACVIYLHRSKFPIEGLPFTQPPNFYPVSVFAIYRPSRYSAGDLATHSLSPLKASSRPSSLLVLPSGNALLLFLCLASTISLTALIGGPPLFVDMADTRGISD